ncbi:MAG: tRNA adenosine(34) deaminase TadA [Pelagibacteraceae bacterium]|nr:tRNA adenosine(34) deaminase TadA [Pelagibacteraceae bacterium]
MENDTKWMMLALNQAKLAQNQSEIPVGAILVKQNTLIAQAHNQSILNNDPTAHAEIQLLRKAGDQQKNYRLTGSTLYVTLEPCTMCFGAMIHARIERIVFGSFDAKTGVCGSCINLNEKNFFNHKISITGGILEKQSSELLRLFFKSKRDK